MQNIDTIREQINLLKDNIENRKKILNERKDELSRFYLNTYKGRGYNDSIGNFITLKKGDFDNVFDKCNIYLSKQSDFMDKVMNITDISGSKMSEHMYGLLGEYIEKIQNELVNNSFYDDLIYQYSTMTDYSDEYKSILLLYRFSDIEGNVILIGGNGSGKSSLAKALKGNDREYISVIPAQKTLYFSVNDSSLLSTRIDDMKLMMLENNISKSKERDDYGYFSYQNNQFSKLIVAMKEDYFNYLMKCQELGIIADSKNNIFGNLKKVFRIIFPEIKLEFETSNSKDFILCKKNDETFHINSLSEGEKAVIYYTISVLMANKNSFIVVDEPETYLNPSLTNILWDTLIKIRNDCQFIFITHSVDFVLGRNEAKIFWIKEFIYPDEWVFEKIEDNFLLPKTLLTEVLGSKKPIIFCEGENKGSLDYSIYHSLFGDKYTVIPIGGHGEVIKYCEVARNSQWLGMECIGIIDGDNFDDEKKELLKEKGIFVLPFNEIEMLIVCDEVIKCVMGGIYYGQASAKIENFKIEWWKLIERKKESVSLTKVKLKIEDFLQNRGIENYTSIISIKQNIQLISEIPVENIFNESNEEINKIINGKEYSKLLKICNLKKEISRGLANKYLDNNFEDKAVQCIKFNEELRSEIISKYFEFIG